jgi:hydrophobic/amphiphilic exporter-1 (mainly G- bacteria), HAE1 family
MRVWLNPNELQARSLTTTDVINQLQGQNQAVAAGQLGMAPVSGKQPFQYTLDVGSRSSWCRRARAGALLAVRDD